MPKFKPGQSGNPAGRPKGSSQHQKLRNAIARNAPNIIEAMIEKAATGDTAAAKILLDRVLPSMKSGDGLSSVKLTGNPSEDARAIITAIGDSELTTGQGQQLLQGLASMARIIEVDELVKRVEKLEQLRG